MVPTKREKAALLFLVITTIVVTTQISNWTTSKNRSVAGPDTCIYDPVHKLIVPGFEYLKERPLLTRIITGIDATLIDVSIITLGAIYAFTGRSVTLMPSLIGFYIIRTIALNIVVFPIPKNYIFADPGIPSIFVGYDKVNDLYFSGHTGCLLICVMDAFQNRRNKLLFFFVPFLIYTVSILLLEGIHYTNDIIIGALTAIMVNRFMFRNRYAFNVVYFKGLVAVYRFFNFIYSETKNKIALFRYEEKLKNSNTQQDKVECHNTYSSNECESTSIVSINQSS